MFRPPVSTPVSAINKSHKKGPLFRAVFLLWGLVGDSPVLLQGECEGIGPLSDIGRHLVVKAGQTAVGVNGAAKGYALAGPGANGNADGGDTLGRIAVGAGVVKTY